MNLWDAPLESHRLSGRSWFLSKYDVDMIEELTQPLWSRISSTGQCDDSHIKEDWQQPLIESYQLILN
jgi:hypothetical protein